MIDLRRDLYARLVISAQKQRELNRRFRVSHVEVSNAFAMRRAAVQAERESIRATIRAEEDSLMEREIANSPIPLSFKSKPSESIIVAKTPPTPKIDEKVDNIVNNPRLSEIKAEIEFAEMLLKKIKSADKQNPKIPMIEETVSRLKSLLDQKMYV